MERCPAGDRRSDGQKWVSVCRRHSSAGRVLYRPTSRPTGPHKFSRDLPPGGPHRTSGDGSRSSISPFSTPFCGLSSPPLSRWRWFPCSASFLCSAAVRSNWLPENDGPSSGWRLDHVTFCCHVSFWCFFFFLCSLILFWDELDLVRVVSSIQWILFSLVVVLTFEFLICKVTTDI